MSAPRPIEPAVLERIEDYPGVVTAAAWKNLVVCTWVSQAVAPAVDALEVALDKLKPRGRLSNVHVIREGLPLPDAAARSGFIRLMTERQAQLACVAIVVGGTGFWASAMRNAIIGLRVFAPRSFDFRLHGTLDEVVDWLPAAHEKQTGSQLPAASLTTLLAQGDRLEPRPR